MWCNIHICLCKCGQYRKHSVTENINSPATCPQELILTAQGNIEDSKSSHHLLENIIYLFGIKFVYDRKDWLSNCYNIVLILSHQFVKESIRHGATWTHLYRVYCDETQIQRKRLQIEWHLQNSDNPNFINCDLLGNWVYNIFASK